MSIPAQYQIIGKRTPSLFFILILFTSSFLFFSSLSRPARASGTYTLDTNFGIITSGSVFTLAEDDEYVYFGGNFLVVGKPKYNNMVLYNKTTNEIENFADHPNGDIYAVAPDGTGGWYIGGEFTKVGSHTIQNLARIKPDRTVDTTWTPNPNNRVRTIYYDGTHVYIGGEFTEVGGQPINRLARVHPGTGALDLAWNPNPNNTVYKVKKDGTDVYVCGEFTDIGGAVGVTFLAKINDTNGHIDALWLPNPNNLVYDIAISPSHVYAVGHFTTINSASRNYAAKLNKITAAVDPLWNPDPDSYLTSIHLNLSDNEIYVGGLFTYIGGENLQYVAKLNDTNGNANPSWTSTHINDAVYDIFVSGSAVYLGGNFNDLMNQDGVSYGIALEKTTGAKVSTWNSNFSDRILTITEQGQHIFMGGTFLIADGIRKTYIARFHKNTDQLDMTWNPNPDNTVYDIEIDNTGIYVGGNFNKIGGTTKQKVAKIDKITGLVDPGWTVSGFGIWETVFDLALSSSHVYIGGEFSSPDVNLIKVNKIDGSIVPWSPKPDTSVRRILYDPSGIYIGGFFVNVNSVTRRRIAKIDDATALPDPSWNPDANHLVFDIHKKDNHFFIGGLFTEIGGTTKNYIAKLNLDGTLDTSWNVDLNFATATITTKDNDVYFVGGFSTINGHAIPYAGKVNAETGAVDTSFNLNLDNFAYTLLLKDHNLYIGGDFGSIQGNHYFKHIAKIVYTPPAPPSAPPSSSSNQNQPTANNTQGKTNPLLAPTCDKEKPKGIPDLFQIDIKDRTAKLYFTPVYDSDSSYYISFSEDPSAEKHGALATLKKEGVQSYDVFFLQPNRTYYFKVRAQNGCATGEWSPIMTATTNRRNNTRVTKVYRYEVRNGVKRVINTIQTALKRR